MSLVFNATGTDKKGIVQIFEKECGFNPGDVSGDSSRLVDFTADCNLAFDDFTAIALPASGTWQFDDSNQTDYPIITTNLVSGQREYPFTVDGTGNLILEVYKVMIAVTGGVFSEIYPIDAQRSDATNGFWDGINVQSVPTRYDKTANAIFLDPIPNYSLTGGLKMYINREPSYFVFGDTTKKPGVPGLFHKYFALKPAQDYARRKNLTGFPRIDLEVQKMELAIYKYFGGREKDLPQVAGQRITSFR